MKKRSFLLIPILMLSLLAAVPAQAAEKIKVVATFSILGDMVKNVAGGEAELTTLVQADQDAHVYQPTPFDADKVAKADLLIVNGLEFEGWIARLQESSGFKGKVVVATAGMDAIRLAEGEAGHEGEFDPHGWHSLANAKIYVENIRKGLVDAVPSKADDFNKNAKVYLDQLDGLEKALKAEIEKIPADRRVVVTSHDAFQYLGRAFGLEFQAPQGLSTESEPSAKDVARIIKQIREHNIKAVFIENISDKRMIEQISRETGATIGGTLYSDALSGPGEPAASFVGMMEHNVRTIILALK